MITCVVDDDFKDNFCYQKHVIIRINLVLIITIIIMTLMTRVIIMKM